MKLLFDEQLSPGLVGQLASVYPGSAHVHDLGLGSCSDRAVWEHAREHGFDIVTNDVDFTELAMAFGAPPRVIWLRLGNCTTTAVEALLRSQQEAVIAFGQDAEALILGLTESGSWEVGRG